MCCFAWMIFKAAKEWMMWVELVIKEFKDEYSTKSINDVIELINKPYSWLDEITVKWKDWKTKRIRIDAKKLDDARKFLQKYADKLIEKNYLWDTRVSELIWYMQAGITNLETLIRDIDNMPIEDYKKLTTQIDDVFNRINELSEDMQISLENTDVGTYLKELSKKYDSNDFQDNAQAVSTSTSENILLQKAKTLLSDNIEKEYVSNLFDEDWLVNLDTLKINTDKILTLRIIDDF